MSADIPPRSPGARRVVMADQRQSGEHIPPTSSPVFDAIAVEVKRRSQRDAAAIERHILEGANEVTFQTHGFFTEVYTVPAWWRHPIRRGKIAWARLTYKAPRDPRDPGQEERRG